MSLWVWITSLAVVVALPAAALEVTVTKEQLRRDMFGAWIAPELTLPTPDPDTPAVGQKGKDPALTLLRSLIARGQAHGFEGMLYDNRDRDHSPLDPALFPRLPRLVYGPDLKSEALDYGRAGQFRFPAVVIGNSSTALTRGPQKRSLSRLAMTNAGDHTLTALLYMDNHLYVYPEHRDYDARDLYPANWPYHVISQGSSHSDRPFLRALVATAAAFPPETFARLQEERLMAPTLQMILRRNLSFVQNEADYQTGFAHRPVLTGKDLRPSRMVALANSMQPEDIPPLVRLTVEEESFAHAAGLGQMSEKLYTTPAAVARIWRSFAWEQSMVVSTARTEDPNDHPLRFTWRLLQGDAEKVTITPLDEAGTRARITWRWHDAYPLPRTMRARAETRETARVDIGVFAENGRSASAPALISVAFPTHQSRTYGAEGESGPVRLMEIDYDAVRREAAFDPMLYWTAPWRDVVQYDAEGAVMGWTRHYTDAPGRASIAHPPREPRYGFDRVDGRLFLRDDAEAAAPSE